ncbi:hypothetical protein GF336_04890 [Candidatus Woesearchaeota archaeon]|nr:hypothetical protein [Candidatus Woesearchaeota archaeon]
MALFGKKKDEEEQTPAATGVPVENVIQMRQQGLSNDQIIQTLQRQGYSNSQVFDAMSQADIKNTMQPSPEQGIAQPENPMGQQVPQGGQQQAPPPGNLPPPPQQDYPAEAPSYGGASNEEVEEIVEGVVEEKWEELMKNVEKIVSWKEEVDGRIEKIEQRMKDLKERFEDLHKGILSKVSEYDKSIKDVGSSINAMEKVFKDTMPAFTKNIGELNRITKNLKQNKKK